MSKKNHSQVINDSVILKSLKSLFVSDNLDTNGSVILGATEKLSHPSISMIFLFLAVILFWYEAPLGKITSVFSLAYLPVILIFLSLLLSGKTKISVSRPLGWYLAFLFSSLISGFFALRYGVSSENIIVGFLVYVIFGVGLLLGGTLARKELFLKGLTFAFLPSALCGIWQYLFSKAALYPITGEEVGRAVGFFTNPNVFGMVSVLLFLVSVWFLIEKKNFWFALTAVIYIIASYVSFSRTAWLALGVGTAALIFSHNKKWLKYTPIGLILLLIPAFRERLLSLFSPQYNYEASIDGRIWTLNNGWHIFKQFPFLGTGPGSFGGAVGHPISKPDRATWPPKWISGDRKF